MIPLLLALLSTPPDDLAFVVAQERWCAAEDHDGRRPSPMPQEIRDALSPLGARKWRDREKASGDLCFALNLPDEPEFSALRWAAIRAVIWGRLSRDAEVRERCDRLWRQVAFCDHCAGEGAFAPPNATVYLPELGVSLPYVQVCVYCGGSGLTRGFE